MFDNTLAGWLIDYSQKDYYPFHMPGHKRNIKSVLYEPSIETDITEIEGFDNLHNARGILKEAQDRASILYGSLETLFSVNGSTAALLSAVSAVVSFGGKVLLARNCHKSVYHGLYLRRIEPVYLYPQWESFFGLNGGISPSLVHQLLIKHGDIQAVVITSPTYDGIVSDVAQIARVCHDFEIPLIVDEAHGAHFSFHSSFPESSLNCGADIVVQSLHKTLPSMTQTALLHRCSDRVSSFLLHRYMQIYQSSSPSYPLMASMDSCIYNLKKRGKEQFDHFRTNLDIFYGQVLTCENLSVVDKRITGCASIYDFDDSKIIISTKYVEINGNELYHNLLSDYHLQMEMSTVSHVLAITGIGDTEEGLQRLSGAILEIDKSLRKDVERKMMRSVPLLRTAINIWEAMDALQREIPLSESEDKICAEFLYIYPPGIPLIVPGEYITGELTDYIFYSIKNGYEIYGLGRDGSVRVIDE